jgi:hypothetical protein
MPEPALQTGAVRAERAALAQLGAPQRRAMLALLQSHFDGVDEAAFHEDLDSKQGAILLKGAGGELLGFSTWVFYDALIERETLRVAYFGDTIVAKAAWGSPALPAAVIRLLMDEAARAAPKRLFSLLICSGFRTYRFMPFFCREFVPRAQPDPALLALRDRLAAQRFGAQYDPASGVARLKRGFYRIKKGLSDPDGHAEVDEASAFFFSANPGWERGDELVCLAEMNDANLSAASRRLLRGPA